MTRLTERQVIANYMGNFEDNGLNEPLALSMADDVVHALNLAGYGITKYGILTTEEFGAIRLSTELAEALSRVVGQGPTRTHDLNELLAHVHAIQHAVMAQIAARTYVNSFRLLGQEIES